MVHIPYRRIAPAPTGLVRQGLSDPVLGVAAPRKLIDACWKVGGATELRALAELSVPA